MQIKALLSISLATCLATATLSAQTPPRPPIAELNRLISAGEHEQAFELSSANLREWEGDTDFDFLFGLAAIDSGHPNESVFAFERVVATATSAAVRDRARLELARAYFLTDNLAGSEEMFLRVLESDPPQNVRSNIQGFLALIDSRNQNRESASTWTLSSTVGSDDNINSATTSSLIDTPLIGFIELNPDGQKTGDEFVDYSLGYRYNHPFTRDSSLEATLNLSRHDNLSTDQFDLDNLRAGLAYSHGTQRNRFRYGLRAQTVTLDGSGFQDSFGFNGSWQHASGSGWYQSLSASATAIRYHTDDSGPQSDLRDVNQLLVSAGITKLTASFSNSLNIYFADEDATQSIGRHNGREFYGIAHNTIWRINPQHMPYARVSVQKVEHDDEHPVFFRDKRSDSTTTAALGWQWKHNNRFSLSSEVSYSDSDSNIELFEYTRFKYQVGVRYQF